MQEDRCAAEEMGKGNNPGRMVSRFDYEKNKPVVTGPLHCMVGCVTCPQHTISFPPLSYVHRLIKERHLVKQAKDGLVGNLLIIDQSRVSPLPANPPGEDDWRQAAAFT